VPRSITNVTNFLQGQAAAQAPQDPASRVLVALAAVKMMPLPDVAAASGLPVSQCLDLVETLRAAGQVEVVEGPDSNRRFLRLTPSGYAQLKDLMGQAL
jgi:hypothetical protein